MPGDSRFIHQKDTPRLPGDRLRPTLAGSPSDATTSGDNPQPIRGRHTSSDQTPTTRPSDKPVRGRERTTLARIQQEHHSESEVVTTVVTTFEQGQLAQGPHTLPESTYETIRHQLSQRIEERLNSVPVHPEPSRPELTDTKQDVQIRGHAQGNVTSWRATCTMVSLEQMVNWYVPANRIQQLTGGASRVNEQHIVESAQKMGIGISHIMNQRESGSVMLITDEAAQLLTRHRGDLTVRGIGKLLDAKNEHLGDKLVTFLTMSDARNLERFSGDPTFVSSFQERSWVIDTHDIQTALKHRDGPLFPTDTNLFSSITLGQSHGFELLSLAQQWNLPLEWHGNMQQDTTKTSSPIRFDATYQGLFVQEQISLETLAHNVQQGPVIISVRGLARNSPEKLRTDGPSDHAIVVHKAEQVQGKWIFQVNDSDKISTQAAFLTRSEILNLEEYTGDNQTYTEEMLKRCWLNSYSDITLNGEPARLYAGLFIPTPPERTTETNHAS